MTPAVTAASPPVLSAVRTLPRVPALDGIRGVAILAVVLFHQIDYIHLPPGSVFQYPLRMASIGSTGVDLFFVLSGFLLTSILLGMKDSNNYYQAFYSRRFTRTLPAYFALAGFVAILLVAVPAFQQFQRLPISNFLLMLQNYYMGFTGTWPGPMGVTWSLAVEEQFYCILPLVVRLSSVRTLAILGAAGWVMAEVSVPLISAWFTPLAGYTFTICRLNALAAGLLCAIAVREKFWISPTLLRVVLIVGLAGTATAFLQNPSVLGSHGRTLAAPTYAALLLLVIRGGRLAAILSWAPLRYVGTISYGIYLYHLVVIELFTMYFGYSKYVNGAAIAATILLSAASWHFFEKPLVQIGQRVKYATSPAA